MKIENHNHVYKIGNQRSDVNISTILRWIDRFVCSFHIVMCIKRMYRRKEQYHMTIVKNNECG